MKVQDPNRIILAKKKKKDIIIWLDMDGVIANWLKAAANTLSIDLRSSEVRQQLKDGKRMESFVGGDEKMWPLINAEGDSWWANMEKLPWADDLVNFLKKQTKDLSFLSSPSDSPLCYSGKIKWVLKNYPELARDVFLGHKKYRCASKNSILIDDTAKKCRQFEKSGGQVFEWPCALSLIDKDIDIDDVLNDLSEKINKMRS